MSCKVFNLLLLLTSGVHLIRASLIFPAASVLQITAAVSAPLEIPHRKLFWDWGLQMNYEFPSQLSQFYNAAIWPDKFEDRKRRDLLETNDAANQTVWYNADKYHNDALKSNKHSSDFTAGELYHSFENLLASYGFHETCMLRSVCELARHPFADDQQNILTEILTFVLTPSIHEAFSDSETLYREVYEEAELRGFLRYNCTELYDECKQDLVTSITSAITSTENNNEDVNTT